MPVWSRSGAAVHLLAVLCVTAGCAAAQQQQPSAVFGTTPDELLRFLARAVQVELRPLVRKLESRVDALDGRLLLISSRMDAEDSKLVSRVDGLDSRLVTLDSRTDELTVRLLEDRQNPQPDELSSRLDRQKSQLDELETKLNSQKSQLDELETKLNSRKSQLDGATTKVDNQISTRLDILTTRLGNHDYQVAGLVTKLDGQQSQLAVLTKSSNSERSRLDGAVNKTASQQTQIDELAVRLDQVEAEQGVGERLPRDCSELPAGAQSGVYRLRPSLDRHHQAVESFCDMDTDGGNWTVIQQRNETAPHQDFYLGWAAYKRGFGDLTGEFWWGLEHLHHMASVDDRYYELMIQLESFDGDQAYAIYQSFDISSEEDGYRLNFTGYTGDAGDSFSRSKFSTHDRDQDKWSGGSCAQRCRGAWWYNWYCSSGNLNGPYKSSADDWDTGIFWPMWKFDSLKKTEMKIRPDPAYLRHILSRV